MRIFAFFPIFIAALLFAEFAKAELTFTEGSISGVSLFDLAEKRIYGGIAGQCAAPSTSSTCNTCTDTTGGLKPCNKTAVHGALMISFTFKSSVDLATTGKKVYLKVGNATVGEVAVAEVAGQAAGTTYTIQGPWSAFCAKAGVSGLNPDCSLSGDSDVVSTAINFIILEDTAKTEIPVTFHGIPYKATLPLDYLYGKQPFGTGPYGLYKYYFRAGDGKLILQEGQSQLFSTTMPSTTPELYGIAYFLDIQDTPTNPVDTSLFANGKFNIVVHTYNKTSGRLDNGPYIENLQNGFQYCVVTGQMNKAQNILAYTMENVDSTVACATPNPVIGILEDKGCFISTAAFGSDMADEVVLFRKFRDDILLKTNPGKWFVEKYYKFSPPLADFIARSEFLRAVARAGLYPLLVFAWLSLNFGFLPTLFFALLLLIGVYNMRKSLRWTFGK